MIKCNYVTAIAAEDPKVLIVDDEEDICYLLGGMLRQRHLYPYFAYSLNEATAALKEHIPTLLFLDNRLPDGYGVDFMPYIKKNFPKTKVVMMTAHDSATDRRRAYAEGVDFFLSKPLNKELINMAINAIS